METMRNTVATLMVASTLLLVVLAFAAAGTRKPAPSEEARAGVRRTRKDTVMTAEDTTATLTTSRDRAVTLSGISR
jgi:hypothetical protein